MANGFSQGFNTGLGLFRNLDYQRRLKQQQDRLDETAALQQKRDKRNEAMQTFKTSTSLLLAPDTPLSVKKRIYEGPYSTSSHDLTGINIPALNGEYSPALDNVIKDARSILTDENIHRTRQQKFEAYLGIKDTIRHDPNAMKAVDASMYEMEAREKAAIKKYAQMIVKHASLLPGAAEATDEEKKEWKEFNEWVKKNPESGKKAMAMAEEIKQQRIEQLPADIKEKIYGKYDPSITEAVKELDPTYSDLLNKTAKYLKELEDKGELSPTMKYVEIGKIMHEEGIPGEMREELVSEIEGLMSGKTYEEHKIDKELKETEIESYGGKLRPSFEQIVNPEKEKKKREREERREEYLKGFYKGEISDVAKNWLDLLGQTPLIGGR